jgi:sec-independent protein translocase protein TatA
VKNQLGEGLHVVRQNGRCASQPATQRPDSQEEKTMIDGLFQPMHLMLIAGIALLIFGPKKLPELGKGLGESIRGFKSAMAAKEEAPSSKSEN